MPGLFSGADVLLAHPSGRRRRRGDGRGRARRRAARRRFRARQPARSRARPARQHRLVVVSSGFFREQLADDIQAQPEFAQRFTGVAPLVVAQRFVTGQESGRRAGQVRVYGVDDRFWRFHGVDGVTRPRDRDALVSPALADSSAQLTAARSSCACSVRRTFRSSRCTAAEMMSAAPCG